MTSPVAEVPQVIWRSRLLAVCLGLTALAFSQRSGQIVADTKLDLTVNPGGLLARSLSLWDPSSSFGQLQNQAYGYLFPMGPFFWLGDTFGLPQWVTQRLWWSLLLCVAFLGMWRLSGALVAASPWARLAGSVIYALSPRIVAELTITSVEVWPMAVAPWVLWPLVETTPRTWRWRVTRSALAAASLGGVNAVASGVALVLPTLWFLTRRPALSTYRWGLVWLASCLAAMAWWIGPLVILGQHSPPFLDWIEGIAVTSSTASVFEALRGTSAWLGFLITQSGPTWPGGFAYAAEPALIVATVALVSAGLVGLGLRPRVRESLFLSVALLAGLLLLTAGHEGGTRSVVSFWVRDLLDGSLAPFRNLHKFDVVVRVPLIIGVIAAIDAVAHRARQLRLLPALVPVVVSCGIVTLAAPALVGQISRPEAYTAIPGYWHDAAQWLDGQPAQGAVLVVPAAGFADFEWGSTKDNPLQALMNRSFVHRDAVPLGSAGATRLLDGLQTELGSGQGGPYLQEMLASAGIRYILVPNDLRLDVPGDDLIRVHSSLEKSGLTRVATFGPVHSTWLESEMQTANYRTVLNRPRIEIFEVEGVQPSAYRVDDLVRVRSAGPENLVSIARVTGRTVSLFDGDGERLRLGEPLLAMDGRTFREVDFGRVAHNRSHLLAEGEVLRQDRQVGDYVIAPEWPQTTQGWDGARRVSASSSASDAGATLRLGPGYGPAAALDGDPDSSWISGRYGQGDDEWIQIDFERPLFVQRVAVQVSTHSAIGATPTSVRFVTESGATEAPVFPNGMAETLIEAQATEWLRIESAEFTPGARNGFGVAEVAIANLPISPRTLVPPAGEPTDWLFHRQLVGTPQCVRVDGAPRCDPTVDPTIEESRALRRAFTAEEGAAVDVSGWVVPRAGDELKSLLVHPEGMRATASSQLVGGVATAPAAAVDGDPATAWVARGGDAKPTLTLRLPAKRELTAVRVVNPDRQAASRADRIRLSFDDGSSVLGRLDDSGELTFGRRSVSRVRITIESFQPLISTDVGTGARDVVPVGIAEVLLNGAEDFNVALPAEATTGAPCGFGPRLVVNGTQYPTRVVGSIGDVREGSPMAWESCAPGTIEIEGGENTLDLVATDQFTPLSAYVERHGIGRSPQNVQADQPVSISRPSSTRLTIHISPSEETQIVAVPQNYSSGWVARSASGIELEPLRLNGWMQAWVVPGNTAAIDAEFTPQRGYQLALGAGLVALAGVVAFAVIPLRRVGEDAQDSVTPPASAGFPSPTPSVVAVVLLFLILAGWLALAVACAALLAVACFRLLFRERSVVLLRLVVVAALTAAAIRVSMDPWPQGQANIADPLVAALSLSGLTIALVLGALANSAHGNVTVDSRSAPEPSRVVP